MDWNLLREEAAERVAQKRAGEEALAAERERKLAEKKAKQEEYKDRIQGFLRNRRFRRIAVIALILVAATFIGVKAVVYHQVYERKQVYQVFCDYIRENGVAHTSSGAKLSSIEFNLTSGYGEWTTYQDPSSEPKILCTFNQFVGGDLTAVLDPGSNTVSLELTTSPAESDSYASAFNYNIPYDNSGCSQQSLMRIPIQKGKRSFPTNGQMQVERVRSQQIPGKKIGGRRCRLNSRRCSPVWMSLYKSMGLAFPSLT